MLITLIKITEIKEKLYLSRPLWISGITTKNHTHFLTEGNYCYNIIFNALIEFKI